MKRRFTRGALALIMLLTAGGVSSAEDWAIRRSPFNPQLVERYKSLLRRRPNDGYALNRLLALYRKHRTVAKLVAEYEEQARAHPGDHRHQIVLGQLYRRTGKIDRAIEALQRAGELRPESAEVSAALAGLFAKQGKKRAAAAAYERALSRARDKGQKKRYLRALATLALSERDVAAARSHFEKLVALEPGNRFLRLELAQALARSENHEAALAEYRRVLERTGDSAARADVLKEIGAQQHKLGRSPEAIASYRKAMTLAARGHWIRRELTERIIAIYREKDDLKSLAAEYEKSQAPKGAFEHEVLGRLYDELGDEPRALAAYQRALRGAQHAVDTRLRLIALLERAGRHKDVLAEYRKLVRIAPGEPRYQLELARRLYRAGEHAAAKKVLEACGRRFPSDASAHSAIADLYGRWGDQQGALREAQVLVRIEPREDSHLINLGEQYFLRGQKRRAIDTWKRLLTAIPQRDKAHAKLAEVYAMHDMTVDAVALYRKAIKINPQALPYRRSLALLLEQKRDSNAALRAWQELLDEARRQKSGQAQRDARTHIIAILQRTYQLRHRMRAYRQTFDGGDEESGFFLAEGHLKLGQLDEAAQVYRQILERSPDNIAALTALEATYRRQRKLAAAVRLLKRLAELEPRSARLHYQRIADLQLQLYNDKEALLYAHKAVALSGRDARAYQKLGSLLEKKEDLPAAIRAYRKALELSPGLATVQFALARLHALRGEYTGAEQAYRELIRGAQRPEIARKAFRLVIDISTYLDRLDVLEKDLQPLAVGGSPLAEVHRQLLVEIYRRRIPLLIHQARHAAPRSRAAAREALRTIGVRGMAPLLEQLATAKRASGGRHQLVRLLGYLGNANAVVPLLRIAEDEPEEEPLTVYGEYAYGYHHSASARRAEAQVNERVEATVAVGRLADDRAIPGLVRLLRDPEGPLREAAAWALSRVRHPRAAEALFRALGDRRPPVQLMACVGLGVQGDRELRPVLEEVMLDARRAAQVRAACAWGLGALRDPRAHDALTEALRTGDDELQRCAAWSLGALADPRAISPLVRAFWHRRGEVRDAILRALVTIAAGASTTTASVDDVVVQNGRIDVTRYTQQLTRAVDELPPHAVARHVPALLETHRDALAAGLRDALGRHRDVVLRVLGDLNRDPGRPTLGAFDAATRITDPRARTAAVRAVRAVLLEVAPRLAELLHHRDATVRRVALAVYSKLAPPGASTRVLGALRDPEWRVRAAAWDALAGLNAQHPAPWTAVAELAQQALRSPHWREREAAVGLLSALRGPKPLPLLRSALADANGFVREAAVKALGGLHVGGATSAVLGALRDEVPHVRAAACAALAGAATGNARAAIAPLLRDPSALVRDAARAALAGHR